MSKKKSKKIIILAIIILVLLGIGKIQLPSGTEKALDTVRTIALENETVGKVVNNINNKVSEVKEKIEDFSSDVKSGIEIEVEKDKKPVTEPNKIYNELEIPQYIPGHQVIRNEIGRYTLSYNSKHLQPDWVAYELIPEDFSNESVGRQEDFREDPAISGTQALLTDYRGSGYDRGHQLPSQDRVRTAEENSQTFLLSNMSPQINKFNAKLNLTAERAVRDAARQFGKAYVVTGPVLTDNKGNFETIGKNKVSIPLRFFKAVLCFDKNGKAYAIGLLMPQNYTDGNLHTYLYSIDELEKTIGFDLFPNLPDEIENAVEASFNKKDWPKRFW